MLLFAVASASACASGSPDTDESTAQPATSASPSPLPNGPDLVVSALSAPTVFPLGDVSVSLTVCNSGNVAAPASTTFLYLSTDTAISASSDVMWAAVPIRGLASGQCEAAVAVRPSPGGPAGAFYVGAWADGPLAIVERSETNNVRVAGPVGIGHGPDLVVRAISAPRAITGGAFAATVQLCNQGNANASQAEADLFLSTDASISATADTFAGTVFAPWLAPGECQTLSGNFNAAVPQPERAYYLGTIADRRRVVTELLENNNTFVSPTLMGVGNRAELVVTRVTPPVAWSSPTSTVEAEICNHGTAPANPDIEVYVSRDQALAHRYLQSTTPDTFVFAQSRSLMPGECYRPRWSLPTPPVSTGLYYVAVIVDPASRVPEFVETDNTGWSGPIGVGQGVDLYVESIEIPEIMDPALAPQLVRARICNAGSAPASSANARFYLSTDRVLQTTPHPTLPPDFHFLDLTVPWLPEGRCTWVSQTMFGLPLARGLYYPIVEIDSARAITEINESNNVRIATTQIQGGADADLAIESFSAPRGLAGFDLTVRVCNRGGLDANPSQVGVFYSRDTQLDPPTPGWPSGPDVPMAPLAIGALPRGACQQVTQAVPPFAEFNGGYLIARANHTGTVTELLTHNNVRAVGPLATVDGPDLTVSSGVVPPVAMSGPFTAQVTVCNPGTLVASTEVSLFGSPDEVLDRGFGPAGDWFLGTTSVPNLEPRSCRTVPVTGPLPGHEPRLVVFAVVDPQGTVSEALESNNTRRIGDVAIGSGPDLIVDRVRTTPRAPGQLELEARVCNQGTARAWSTQVELLWSTDTTYDGSPAFDDFPITSLPLAELAAGACATVRHTAPLGTPLQTPTAYLLAVADPGRWMTELREENNVGVGPRVVLAQQPDLEVVRLTGPQALTNGVGSGVVEVCNRGNTPASPTAVELFASEDAQLSRGQDFLVTSVQVGGLSAAACISLPWSGPVFGAPLVRILAAVDSWNSVVEAREDNNVLASGVVPTGTGPNVVVTRIVVPTAVLPGSVEVRLTVCNRGNAPDSGTVVDLVMSEDTTYDPFFDPPHGVFVPALAPGACVTEVRTLWSTPMPRFYVLAVVDPFQQVNELLETDQVAVSTRIAVGSLPDFVVESVSQSAGRVQVRACNRGTAAGFLGELSLYASDDERIRGFPGGIDEDRPIGMVSVGTSLAAGACITTSAPIPGVPVPSPSWLGAVADEFGATAELFEDNNTLSAGPY